MHVLRSDVKRAATLEGSPIEAGHQRKTSTRGTVHYVDLPKGNEQLYLKVYTEDQDKSNLELSPYEVEVHDVRPVQSELTLEKNGFNLYKLKVPDLDWQNKDEVEKVYYPLVEKLLLDVTQASRIHVFDHTLRLGKLQDREGKKVNIGQEVTKPNQPVGMAHVDYTHESGIDRLDALLPEEAENLRKTPFAVIQVWRPIRGPVKASPLGMIDASTVDRSDLSPYEIRFPGRTGYNFAVHHSDKHKWYYAQDMETDEAYVFVCYDSRLGRARFTPHTGFRDLSIGEDAPPRESVELRAYAFWEHEPPQEVKRVW